MVRSEYYPLETFVKQKPLEINTFLPLAIEIVKSVYVLHKKNHFFNNLSPSNIWVNDEYKAKVVRQGTDHTSEKKQNYISPEQVLKNDAQVNQSSDIYVLGIIFYELLTGEVPYKYSDILEFSHATLTQKIPILSEVNSTVPYMLTLIVEKMVAMNQEERYKELLSVSIDLLKIDNDLKKSGHIIDFEIDTFQSIYNIHTHKMIYGRKKEEEELQYYINSKSSKANKIILVHGRSGIGKSALINKVIEKNRQYFSHVCRFKLDASEQSTPYQILYMALSRMIKEIITQDEKTLQRYATKLKDVLGEQAYALKSVIPEVEILLGKCFAQNTEEPIEKNVNLDNLLVRFMEIFIDAEQPLCIYIDDIQWADNVTLKWVKNMILNLENIILFMNYRDDEMDFYDTKYLSNILHELSSFNIKTHTVKIEPLSIKDVENLIKDNIQLESSHQVAKIIFDRTKGNPFFVKEYLKKLYSDEAIWFDMEYMEWKCDLASIEDLQVSDNVFDMLSNNIGDLPLNVRKLLCIASCMGHIFSHTLLEKVFNDKELFNESLTFAISSGWIKVDQSHKMDDKSYRFLHDKMQQTIHEFLIDKMRQKLHYKIGCHLEDSRESSDHKNLLVCVNHLNIGSSYVRDKDFLGELNLEASMYAKKSGDFESALNYIKYAMELSLLNSPIDTTVLMLKQRAECEHLCNHSDEAIVYYERSLELADTPLKKGEIYELLIKLYSDISQFSKAYEVGRTAIKSFGIDIPKKFTPPLFLAEFLQLKFKLRKYTVEDLIELPTSTDEDFIMTIRLMANILQAAYQIQPELSVANALIIVKLCLENGLTKESVIGFTVFGVIFQGAILGNHTLGYDYSRFSFDMLEKFDNTTQHAEVKFVCGYFGTSWLQPALETEANWLVAYKSGLEIGDWFHTGCAAAGIIQSMFMRGVSFEDILSQINYFDKMLLNIGAKEQYGAMMSVKQTILNLKGQTKSDLSYNDDNFDELAYVKSLEGYESEHFAHYYYVNKMISLYLHQAYNEAYEISLKGKRFSKSSKGMLHHTEYLFYNALILSKRMNGKTFNEVQSYKRKIERVRKKYKKWSQSCSENFLVRFCILEAETNRINKKYSEAFLYYDKAIDLATVYGQQHLVGIANRLSEELYSKLDQTRASKSYQEQSRAYFYKWGMNCGTYIQSEYDKNIDIRTLTKASEVISKEHEFSKLLKTLIRIIMENVGAQYGYLLLEKDGDYVVQSSANEDMTNIQVMQEIPYQDVQMIVHPVITYVLRTKESIVIEDMAKSSIFDRSYDPDRTIKSVFCAPLILQNELKGIIYLENNLLPSVFTKEKVKFIQHLSGQIVISIENTIVYNKLEEKIKQRTKDLEASKDKLKRLASIDPMTELYNRRYFSEISKDIFNMSKRTDNSLTVVMLDIDNFKSINDTYGHHIGDKVIIGIASILLDNTRKSDIVCRYGGEEYIILLPDTELDNCMKVMESIRKSVEDMTISYDEGKELSVTISIGVAIVDMELEHDIEVTIHKADNALYTAKRSGKNQIVVYNGIE